jgi:LEA14-like dessication related protein
VRILPVVFLLVLGIAGCAGAPARLDPLSVTLSDISPAQIGLLEQEYAIKIRVQNPNDTAIRIEGLSYQIDLNGKPFAKGVSRQSASVPAFGEVMLDATAISNLGAMMSQIAQMQKDGMPERFSYHLQGKLGLRQSSIPFDSQGNIELPSWNGGVQ